MSDIRQLTQAIFDETNRLEVLGDAVALEARQIGQVASAIERELDQAEPGDLDLDRLNSLRRVHDELVDGVHPEVLHQLDTMRDLSRSIR